MKKVYSFMGMYMYYFDPIFGGKSLFDFDLEMHSADPRSRKRIVSRNADLIRQFTVDLKSMFPYEILDFYNMVSQYLYEYESRLNALLDYFGSEHHLV